MALSEQEKHPKRKTSSLRNLGINLSSESFPVNHTEADKRT
jgi:hypothetical protein